MNLLAVKCIILIILCVNSAEGCKLLDRKAKIPLFCSCQITAREYTSIEYHQQVYVFLVLAKCKCFSSMPLPHHTERCARTHSESSGVDLRNGDIFQVTSIGVVLLFLIGQFHCFRFINYFRRDFSPTNTNFCRVSKLKIYSHTQLLRARIIRIATNTIFHALFMELNVTKTVAICTENAQNLLLTKFVYEC